ncbi:MAG: peptidoglycan-binding protein [Alphaproteobacteria bacterium]|nr:peptidoglycan-binding protein [Alphaproteobacteria bacterium]
MNIAEVRENATLEALKCVGLQYSQAKRLQKAYRDCSSLVARAYTTAGHEWGCYGRPVPRSLEEVYDDGFQLVWPENNDYASIGKSLPTSSSIRKKIDLQRSDLLFAATKGTASTRKNKIEHVVMLTSATRIVHARGTAYGVREDNVSLYDAKICAVARFNPLCDLVKGHVGSRTKALQEALNQNGATLTVDRDFGSKTLAAVQAYQTKKGLPVTGKGDAATRAALGIVDAWSSDEPVATSRPTIKRGSKGAAVTELQTYLKALKYSLGTYGANKDGIDGDFGKKTEKALIDYQGKQGISADGVCGPVTWAHLTGEMGDDSATAADNMQVRVTASKSAYVRTVPSIGEPRGVVYNGAILKATGGIATVGTVQWYNVVYDGESVWISSKMAVLEGANNAEADKYVAKGKIPDISKWQGNVDFAKLSTEADFVIARGLCRTTKDEMIDAYADGMVKNKIPFGVYNFTYAETIAEAQRDAKLFFEATHAHNPLYYVLDAEVSTLTQEIITAWVETMRGLTTAPVGCYVAHHMYGQYNYKDIAHLFDFTWIPRYGKNSGAPETKPAYPCDLWQFTSAGKIAGVSGKVDLNQVTGQGKDLAWFRGA